MAKKPKKIYLYQGPIFRIWEDGTRTDLAYDNFGEPRLFKFYRYAVSDIQFAMFIKRFVSAMYGVNYHDIELNKKYIYIKEAESCTK